VNKDTDLPAGTAAVALFDAMLLAFRDQVGQFDSMERLGDVSVFAGLQPVVDALALIRKLHVGRNHRPIADTCGCCRRDARTRRRPGLRESRPWRTCRLQEQAAATRRRGRVLQGFACGRSRGRRRQRWQSSRRDGRRAPHTVHKAKRWSSRWWC
jgi:hypothetical protein